MFDTKNLFKTKNEAGERLSEYHLAEMVAILGPPPLQFLQRSETSWEYFDQEGKWKADFKIPDTSLETRLTRLDGEEKVLFLQFLRKMLKWVPEERQTTRELLDDPWLNIAQE